MKRLNINNINDIQVRIRRIMTSRKIGTYIRGISIVCFCILLAVQSVAQALPHGFASDSQQAQCNIINDCPCNDGNGERGCDSACSCCSCFASLSKKYNLHIVPTAAILSVTEPLLLMPQVYLTIFVPPQNRS